MAWLKTRPKMIQGRGTGDGTTFRGKATLYQWTGAAPKKNWPHFISYAEVDGEFISDRDVEAAIKKAFVQLRNARIGSAASLHVDYGKPIGKPANYDVQDGKVVTTWRDPRRLSSRIKVLATWDPEGALANDINREGRYKAEVRDCTVPEGRSAKATTKTWDEDGVPVLKAFRRARRRPIPPGKYQGVFINDGTVYLSDGRWWYQASESDVS